MAEHSRRIWLVKMVGQTHTNRNSHSASECAGAHKAFDGMPHRVQHRSVQCSSSHSLRGAQQQSRTDSEEWSLETERNRTDVSLRLPDVSCLQSNSVLPTCLLSIEESEERQSGDSDNSQKDGTGVEKKFS